MAVTNVIKNCLYISITNHCTNRCEFCGRDRAADETGPDFRLEREPTLAEIIGDVTSYNLNTFREIVFGGFGEPSCRLYDMLETCRKIRELTTTPIRIITNGHASMILSEDTAPMFRGLVDCVSISLNAADSDTYTRLCRPKFGDAAFAGVLRFARELVRYVPAVILTVPRGVLSDEDVEKVASIAADIGATFSYSDFPGN